ncbi:MAG: YfiR family protein [Acidobacteriaceae bacterium]
MGTFRRCLPRLFENRCPHGSSFRALLLAALLCSSTLLPSQNAAQTRHPTQDDVEAAYLYNFGRFVHWPPNPRRYTLNICILGSDPFGSTLDRILANETINGLGLAAMRLSDTASVQSCAIVFLGYSEASHLDRDLSALAALPVLTVSDMPGFIEHGGMVQFVLENDNVRFEVNLSAANKSGLALSSQLLKVAARVVGNPDTRGAR